MSFNYQVILKPKDVKFSSKKIPNRFDNGTPLTELLEKLKSGEVLTKDIAAIEVVWNCEQWEWYALNNRRLWVFQEMQRAGKITYIGMSRVELLGSDESGEPPKLHKMVELYTPQWDVVVSPSMEDLSNKVMSIDFDSLPKSKSSRRQSTTDESKSNSVPQQMKCDNERMVEKTVTKKTVDKVTTESSAKENYQKTVTSTKTVVSKVDFNRDFSLSRSLSSSKYASLDNISSFSKSSNVSSISRGERRISEKSGLFGYGYYDVYSTEYLSKIKASRNNTLRRYKPYNVFSSSFSSRRNSLCSSLRSLKFDEKLESQTKKSRSCSESSTIREDRNSLSNSNTTNDDRPHSRRNRRTRLYSDDIECDESFGYQDSVFSSKTVVPYDDTNESLSSSGVKLKKLYAVWQQRRNEYLRTSRLAIMNGSVNMYLCGLCFKKFHTIVDLQQHSEALMHYACITCGKFFASYASLGQHCQNLGHQKD